MSQRIPLRVFEPPAAQNARQERLKLGKPAHWVDQIGSAFVNPWDSFRLFKFTELPLLMWRSLRSMPSIPNEITKLIPVRTPTWGLESQDASKIKATWLGHACFLVELPARAPADGSPILSRGPRILFDPVFSQRCSPSQWIGPKRYTPIPCPIEEIPEFDAIVISHNHYDHLDTDTLKTLFRRERTPHIFIPLGNAKYLQSIGVPDTHAHVLDWWESRRVETEIPLLSEPGQTRKVEFDVTATPCQHISGRSIHDRCRTLWASWVVEEVSSEPHPEIAPVKTYFAGDTGYRTVDDGQDEDTVPFCPAFKEIGEKFGGIDFAMIPIGAYLPRHFMSPVHCAPQDSVRLFKDVKAKNALGMHWGTWVLTIEDVIDPPKRLQEECEKQGIEKGAFGICDIGETTFW